MWNVRIFAFNKQQQTLKTNIMEFTLFKGFTRIGSIYFTFEEAKKAIDGAGIWNICGVVPVDGKLKIVSRQTIVNK